ncbi:hypothetical protein [Streptomyces roseochromogenus]|uniref:hypothetical protein n=1 Tax=Streptomyces roseochromogenus TaxID=285450 RepID=UPI000B19567A|nr:hypothetical protein [Streptomyces roseochromogenus]
MDPEWVSLLGAFGVSAAALLVSEKLRSILRTIFRRPRETSLLVKEPDGRRVIEIRGPANLSAVEAEALLKAWREAARKPPTVEDTPASSGESVQRAAGAESDE